MIELIDRLAEEHSLSISEYQYLIEHRNQEAAEYAASRARSVSQSIYGKDIFVRGIIEFSNICRNDCYYCGIRKSNDKVRRYALTPEQILQCAEDGYSYGFRTIVLQSGEEGSPAYIDGLCQTVRSIKERHPDVAITLSVGELERDDYEKLYQAGADRYLLRHETADPDLYRKLHPKELSLEHRMNCLRELRSIGYDVGAGFMVGSPWQTARDLAEDLKFIETFKPEMCGIGPFIPHRDTPLRDFPAGGLDLTLFLLSLIRLAVPDILLPATTALGTIDPEGREKGVLAGANVIMPNLSPVDVRRQYELYNDKICMGDESAQCRTCVDMRMFSIGYRVVIDRGDIRRRTKRDGRGVGLANPGSASNTSRTAEEGAVDA